MADEVNRTYKAFKPTGGDEQALDIGAAKAKESARNSAKRDYAWPPYYF